MSQSPPAALVRLREADVVRLCGLAGAARGLDLAARHAVSGGRRTGSRLEAAVTDGDRVLRAWAELVDEGTNSALTWGCLCRDGDSEAPPAEQRSRGGCEHVAALLSAWIRIPADFAEPETSPEPSSTAGGPLPSESRAHAHLTQPALLGAPTTERRRGGFSLADELARLPAQEVIAIARRVLGAEPAEAEARMALSLTLSDPVRVAPLLARLDSSVRELFHEIVLLGGIITGADLDALGSRSGRAPSASRAAATVLVRHGLLFAVAGSVAIAQDQPEQSWRQISGWRIPPEVRSAAPASLPFAPMPSAGHHGPPFLHDARGEPTSTPARLVRSSPRSLCLALVLLARAPRPYGVPAHLHDSGASTAPTERTPRTDVMLVAGDLAPATLADLARRAGVSEGMLRTARRILLWAREQGPAAPLGDFGTVPPEERLVVLRSGFRLWRNAETAAELADLTLPTAPARMRFDRGHPAVRPAALATEARDARAFVLGLLERAQPGTWYAVADLVDLVWRIHPLFLRGRQTTYETPAWWLERPGEARPLRPTVREEWLDGEGMYIRALLAGPLHGWGVLDLAIAPDGQRLAFRLTPLGQYLLARTDGPLTPEVSGACKGDWGPPVLPTRDGALAVHPLAAERGLVAALDVWARPREIAGGRLVYHLDADLASTAFDQGVTPDGLMTHLRKLETGGEARLSAFVGQRLETWAARHGESRIEHDYALVEAPDAATLAEALAYAPEIAAHARALSPSIALIPAADAAALREILSRRGYAL